jgi:mono/diheme cytochrome c family protein
LAAADPEVGANQSTPSGAEDAGGDPQLGYRWLTERAYLPADFHQETFEQIWKVWPAELRERARAATPEQRREMAYARYGLTPRPGDPQQRPLQYVVGEDGSWTMNCFACHGGTVYGETYPGAPNNRYALQTLTEEMRKAKFATGGKMTRMDLGSLLMPLGSTVGRTNAVMFGVGLMHYRRPDLSIDQDAGPPQFTHHDMDAPPWWHFHRKEKLYIDGFASKGHRGLMQFTLVRENGPEKFRQWEEEFRDIYAYLMTLRPPQYPGRIDRELAAEGRRLFNDTCARCHGTYDAGGSYPGVTVPIEELGTDPVRLSALPVEGRKKYAASWFAHAGEPEAQETVVDPAGYVAPPLDGVWASAPYFHNGSVPTLWHVLHPGERPRLWRRSGIEMDSERVGLQVRTADRIPLSQTDPAERREWFDTAGFGKSAAGHEYPLELSVVERRAVLEYLKTL